MKLVSASDARPRTRRLSLWTLHRADSPIIGTAIHDGHLVDGDIASLLAVAADVRLREEDPFTGDLIAGLPSYLVFHRSRFTVDLNRAREQSVYLSPAEAWDLDVWHEAPSDHVVARLREIHDQYYAALASTLDGLEKRFGTFLVLDVHSYNHRRAGAKAPATAGDAAPDINIGTASMDRVQWARVVEGFMEFCASRMIMGRRLDVRENVAFEGRGEQTRFIHERFPRTGCAIAVEFKKIFMDEWTGEPNRQWLAELRALLTDSVPVLERALKVPRP
ncbi:N-formylglutamate amidohydrolase [Hyphomicrobium sp. CS1GBMeth3]|uniref:N-formylglutamate amidohydrolase n=1 Tax=Hyphomicrobium sp. CS1GBMeth3 TaxID=1892845 RepID=UPI0009310B69|nr:N-formylglutamate amidohydrolase [Hyphomicrobium sp. CS1GBMeth3]